jgi:hypothetical protein
VRAEVGLSDLLLDAQTPVELDEKRRIAPRVSFDKIEFGARWLRGEHGWSVDVDKLTVARQGATLAPASLHVESQTDPGEAEPTYTVRARDIDISAPASVAMLAENLPMPWRRWLYAGNPEGTLPALALRWSGADDYDVAANVDNMGLARARQGARCRRLERDRARRPAGADDESVRTQRAERRRAACLSPFAGLLRIRRRRGRVPRRFGVAHRDRCPAFRRRALWRRITRLDGFSRQWRASADRCLRAGRACRRAGIASVSGRSTRCRQRRSRGWIARSNPDG